MKILKSREIKLSPKCSVFMYSYLSSIITEFQMSLIFFWEAFQHPSYKCMKIWLVLYFEWVRGLKNFESSLFHLWEFIEILFQILQVLNWSLLTLFMCLDSPKFKPRVQSKGLVFHMKFPKHPKYVINVHRPLYTII